MKKLGTVSVVLLFALHGRCVDVTPSVYGIWHADMPGYAEAPAFWLSLSRDGIGRMQAIMLWRWGVPHYPESVSCIDGVARFRIPLKAPPKSVAGSNRYVKRRLTTFKWFTAKVVEDGRLLVKMEELNYFGHPVKGIKCDLGEFYCNRSPDPGPAPDLNALTFGEPLDLLANGLQDWEPVKGEHSLPDQWSFNDGVLSTAHKLDVNGGWIGGCNLKTKRENFGDFRLSFDFRLPEFSNSGVWLRGSFEVNICDSYGWAADMRNSGTICGLMEPLVSAEKKYGEWQHVDIWIVRRHATVILNGKTTVDNAPLIGVTGGARTSDIDAPGPLVLQGDHSGCDFRNMILTPVWADR